MRLTVENSEIFKNLVTALAVIVAGLWTYFLFVKDVYDNPNANIDVGVQCHDIDANKRLIYVNGLVENIGTSDLTYKKAEMRLRQVLPLQENIAKLVREDSDIVYAGKDSVEWNVIAQRKWESSTIDEVISIVEPSEKGELQTEFVISGNIDAIEIYFFIANPKLEGYGWTKSKLFSFYKGKESNKKLYPGTISCVPVSRRG